MSFVLRQREKKWEETETSPPLKLVIFFFATYFSFLLASLIARTAQVCAEDGLDEGIVIQFSAIAPAERPFRRIFTMSTWSISL